MANTQFPVNANRYDPYKNFRFHVYWDGQLVAGVSKVSAIVRKTEMVEHREGGDNTMSHKSPGRSSVDDITLERGLTHDPEFEKWANLVWNNDGLAGMSLKDYKKPIRIVLLNAQATPVKAFNLYNCWVKEFQTLPELDANANAVAIERIVLATEYFERDLSVTETMEF